MLTTSGPGKPPGRLAGDRLVRYIGTLRRFVNMPHRQAGRFERRFERERTAEQEAHEIVAPQDRYIRRLVADCGTPRSKDPVARHIAAQIRARCRRTGSGLPGAVCFQERAGAIVQPAELGKIVAHRALRQDDQVRLHDSRAPCRPWGQ